MVSIKDEVEKEVEKIWNSYIASVHRLNSDNGTAASFSKDYEGRQIYELLQNAEDQVKDNNGFVKIELYGNTLKVFNTGEPFNAKGFISILYVCDSPYRWKVDKIKTNRIMTFFIKIFCIKDNEKTIWFNYKFYKKQK